MHMAQTRQFHNLSIAVAKADSDRVCYLIMPEGESKKLLDYIDSASVKYNCSMVVISGINWNDDLTPWPAPGVFKQKKPFGCKAFLCLGDSEHKSKESRMATVQQCTEAVVATLQQKGIETTYRLVPGTHFSDIEPRLDQAFDSLLG